MSCWGPALTRPRSWLPENAPVHARSLSALLASAVVAVLAVVPPAHAVEDPAPACPDLVPALDAPAGLVTDAAWEVCPAATAHAAAWAPAADFPGRTGDVALMTTGSAAQATKAEPAVPGGIALGQETAEPDDGPHGPVDDRSTYRITVDVPAGDNCLGFDYVVGSDEFGQASPHMDGFVATIDGDGWRLYDPGFGGWLQFESSDKFAGGPLALADPQLVTHDSVDLAYVRSSEVQHAAVGVAPGSHTIRLSIFDSVTQGTNQPYDGLRDTAVLLDRLRTWADPVGCDSPHNQRPTAWDAGAEWQPLPVYAGGPNQLPLIQEQYADDPDGDQLQLVAPVELPAHGDVTCQPTSCSYTPDEGYTGPDQFRFRVTDGKGGFASAVAWLDVRPNVPVLSGNLQVTSQGAGGHVTAQVVVQDSLGVARPGAEVALWGAKGDDPLAEVATGVAGESGLATITFHPPSTGQWRFRATAAEAEPFDLETVWFDLDPVQTLEVAWPAKIFAQRDNTVTVRLKRASGQYATTGSVSVEVGDFRGGGCCVPVGTFEVDGSGVATFVLHPHQPTDQLAVNIRYDRDPNVLVQDQRLVQEPGVGNSPPDVQGEQVAAVAHQPLAIDVATNDSDAEGDALTYAVLSEPQHGTLSCETDGDCVYRPGGYVGPDSFTYTATDGLSAPVEGTVEVQVGPAPAPAVTLLRSAATQSVKGRVTLSGKVAPASAGAPLQLQRLDGGTWTTIGTRSLSAGASVGYSFSVGSTSSRTARYRVVLPSYDARSAGASTTVTVGWQAAALVAHRATGREWVQVRNTGRVAINLSGWTVRTCAGFVLRLPARSLAPGASVRVYVGRVARLGDRHDVLTLRTPRGVVAAVRRY